MWFSKLTSTYKLFINKNFTRGFKKIHTIMFQFISWSSLQLSSSESCNTTLLVLPTKWWLFVPSCQCQQLKSGKFTKWMSIMYFSMVIWLRGVYMKVPLSFQNSDPNLVCRLKKSLYDLKQVPHCWFAKLTVLKHYGFVQSYSDYSLFILHRGK